MKKIKNENQILIMLALFSVSVGLWGNFRQLWLQDNNFAVTNISSILSIGTLISVIIIGLIGKYVKLDKLKDIQILSSMRKGDLGVINLNNELQKYLNPPHKFKVEESFQKRIFRVGDKVMQIKNNYTKKWENEDKSESGEGIYNGDIGYIYHIDKENKKIYVLFDQVKIVSYGYDELDELDHSFCTTIHKSQGSEFPVVVIPITWAPPMLLSRNLLYTAVTRAKKLVVLVGDVKYLEYMIKNNRTNDRYSNLSYKLNKFREEGLLIK